MSHKCSVLWCVVVPTRDKEPCALHAKRPVLHSLERRDEYFQRLRAEDAAAAREVLRAKLEAAGKEERRATR